MAKIEFVHQASEYAPSSTETIEVRVWGQVGTSQQEFYIGSGVNFNAGDCFWVEIVYSVEGAQIFYTRNFLQNGDGWSKDFAANKERYLMGILEEEEGSFGFADMLPETCILLTLSKKSYPHALLEISADASPVFGRTGPGERSLELRIGLKDAADGERFMCELIHEIDAAYRGKHPDPASFPPGSCEWPFVWQLNRKAYTHIADEYQEEYFDNPLLAAAFDEFLAKLPAGGKVLDAGCGHGDPTITRLLERGFQPTGSDFTPKMLKKARQRFPQVPFVEKAITEIDNEMAFDGVCSFNSLVYMDPIDFLNGIQRVHRSLKSGGLLFLFGYDSGPDWRGEPLHYTMDSWMWSWHYGMEEAAGLLKEHNYFKVLDAHVVDPEQEGRKTYGYVIAARKKKV